MRQKLINYWLLFLLVVLAACANRVPPDGGPRDRTAPQVLLSLPAQKSIDIQGNRFEFTFDEFIQLKDGGSSIMVSPPLRKPPDAVLQGKRLVLKMNELLDSNTTYTITIGAGIVDLTESNPLEPYSLVFSTGPNLDSLSCFGNVRDAFNGEVTKDVLVMLYRSDTDSLPKTMLPRYFAKTDASGNYKIENLKGGTYKVFALKDVNSNYLYDQPGEMIGFPNALLAIDSARTAVEQLSLSAEEAKAQRLIRNEYLEPGQLTLKYALSPDSIQVTDFLGEKVTYFKSDLSSPDSLSLFFKRFQQDSVKLYIRNYLKGELHTDTLEFKSRKQAVSSKKGRKGSAVDTSLKVTSNIEGKKLLPGEALRLLTNYPSQLTDSASFKWVVSGDTLDAGRPGSLGDFAFSFKPPSAPGKAIYLLAAPGSISDLYNHINDSLKLDFRVMDTDETGNLEIVFRDFADTPQQVLLELTDGKGRVIKALSVNGQDSLVIESLRPGTFKLRAIEDRNKDGRWTPANYDAKTQAEPVFRYSEEIAIRAGWDLAVEFEINLPPEEKKRPDKPASEE